MEKASEGEFESEREKENERGRASERESVELSEQIVRERERERIDGRSKIMGDYLDTTDEMLGYWMYLNISLPYSIVRKLCQ